MSRTCSPTTGKPYDIAGVGRLSGYPRSSFFAQGGCPNADRAPVGKCGPKCAITNVELLETIRTDLDQPPFRGEEHRKVWGRLKYGQGPRVSRKRVLRLMREHHLLSPYRRPQGIPRQHTGEIITTASNLMWGTEASKVSTLEDGYVWVFAAVEHLRRDLCEYLRPQRSNRRFHSFLQPPMAP
jgi:putative transposase